MTFNNNKFGILTNWKCAVFLQRAEVAGRHTLDFYTVELDGNQDTYLDAESMGWDGIACRG
jgi:hypothetical protein